MKPLYEFKSQAFNKLYLIALILVFIPLSNVLAVVQNLNGETGQNQFFVNDTNIAITSAGNNHTFIWNGILPVARGGTGISSFATGSIPFFGNGVLSENNSALFWDNVNSRLGIRTTNPSEALTINGNIFINGNSISTHSTSTSLAAEIFCFTNNSCVTSWPSSIGGTDGQLQFNDGGMLEGMPGTMLDKELLQFEVSFVNDNSGIGLYVANADESDYADISIVPDQIYMVSTEKIGFSAGSGQYYFGRNEVSSDSGALNFSNVTGALKTYTFPNLSGTLGVLEADQTWSGANKFSQGSAATTTVDFGQIGDSTSRTCFNAKNTTGDDISFYFVGVNMVIENTPCVE